MKQQISRTAQPASDRRARLGERLRALRRARGLTLQDVASRAGLAVSTVSKVERGLMAPTYDRFSQLADGLGVDIAELFSERGERFRPGEFAVARRGEYRRHETENYVYEMLFPEVWGKTMTPMMGDLRAFETMRFDRFVSHPGEEFLLVLKGGSPCSSKRWSRSSSTPERASISTAGAGTFTRLPAAKVRASSWSAQGRARRRSEPAGPAACPLPALRKCCIVTPRGRRTGRPCASTTADPRLR